MTQCTHCLTASTRTPWGGFDAACVDCCARKVLECHPDKARAGATLEALTRRPDRPSREDVLARVRQILESRP